MPMVECASVAEYIAGQPKAAQAVLKKVRSTIRKALPKAQESLAYRIPAYRIDGKVVIYFAGWKNHYSLYPCGPEFVTAFKKQLARYECNRRGTLQFPLDEDVPVRLIAAIAKHRARQVAARRKKS